MRHRPPQYFRSVLRPDSDGRSEVWLEIVWGFSRFHSLRSATSGSSRAARQAGTRHAAIATAVRRPVIEANVTGSVGETWMSTVLSTRLRPNAPRRPRPTPIASCTSPWRRINQDTSFAPAPSAIRTPISVVRCVTEYAITAYSPTDESTSAIRANNAKRLPKTRYGQVDWASICSIVWTVNTG